MRSGIPADGAVMVQSGGIPHFTTGCRSSSGPNIFSWEVEIINMLVFDADGVTRAFSCIFLPLLAAKL